MSIKPLEKRKSFKDRLFSKTLPKAPPPDAKFGIKTFCDPTDANVDIVFVHGITGHRENTWTVGRGRPWPETLLPAKVPRARILSFGYDASVIGWGPSISGNGIDDHARNLLGALAAHREVDGTNDRPLVFVCHSLGGLVCQAALLASRASPEVHLQQILDRTRAILFLGTPHSGVSLAVVGHRLARLANLASGANSRIIEVLRRDSEVLARIQHEFRSLLRLQSTQPRNAINITCVYEELPMPGIGEIVPKHSAVLPEYTAIGIHSNHRDIARFRNESDPGFICIANELQRWASDIQSSKPAVARADATFEAADLVSPCKTKSIGGIIIYGDVLHSNVVNGSQVIHGNLEFGD